MAHLRLCADDGGDEGGLPRRGAGGLCVVAAGSRQRPAAWRQQPLQQLLALWGGWRRRAQRGGGRRDGDGVCRRPRLYGAACQSMRCVGSADAATRVCAECGNVASFSVICLVLRSIATI